MFHAPTRSNNEDHATGFKDEKYDSFMLQRTRASSNAQLPLYGRDRLTVSSRAISPDPNSSSRKLRLHKRRSLYFIRRQFAAWRPWLRRFLQCAVPLAVFAVLYLIWNWEVHIEVMFYSRSWIDREVVQTDGLSGCFEPSRISSAYNVTAAFGPKNNEVQAGLPLRLGTDCYEFASTIQPSPESAAETTSRTNFHTYWRTDLVPFGERQEWMIKSYLATQNLATTRLILWSNGDLSDNARLQYWMSLYPDALQLRTVDVDSLARGTDLESSALLHAKDSKAWVDGDLVRLLVTWTYGGVWIDMDSLLSRDLSPLLEHEFVTQWDCYDKRYQSLNGALMHFRQHSPYLCEAFNIMARSPRPRGGSTDWGSLLYLKLWRRLVISTIPPFKVLPFCFSDARSCRQDNRLPDPFKPDPRTWANGYSLEEGGGLDRALSKIFSVHLHNQWDKNFPREGWVERLLLRRFDHVLKLRANDPSRVAP